MANFTMFLSDALKKRMKVHSHVRWSSAIRSIIERKLDDLEAAERLAQKSRITQEDVKRIALAINSAGGRHAKVLFNESRR